MNYYHYGIESFTLQYDYRVCDTCSYNEQYKPVINMTHFVEQP